MKLTGRSASTFVIAAGLLVVRVTSAQSPSDTNFLRLRDGWRIQSSTEAKSDGGTISAKGFDAAGWHSAAVPTTVLDALVHDGTYKDIYMGSNLDTIPVEQFKNAWWYRDEFEVSAEQASGCGKLTFEGINYRANVWLNGERIAATNETFGAYKMFGLDVTGKLKPGKNVLAVEVFPPQPGDFTMGFVDWNPKPPDRNMGLFRPVELHFYQSVSVENIFVESKIDHATWRKAELTVRADVSNHSDKPVDAMLKGDFGSGVFSEKIALQAGEKREIKLTPEAHPQLKLDDAQLWWPWELGAPYLYTLNMKLQLEGIVSDQQTMRFGIRETRDYTNEIGARGYVINGQKILIRGGGWADELLLHEDTNNVRAQVEYTKAMNLNTIRLEGIWGSSSTLYDLADENGMLVMVGWSCQWEWANNLGKKCDKKYGGFMSETDMQLATNYLHDQVFWLRNHPSIYVWVLGSDMLPNPDLEKRYGALLSVIDPTRPTLISCANVKSLVSGPSGVKMNGPYDYVTPDYWYLDTKNGGAFGFNTETGPGPQPPPLETLQQMFPADKLWPINDSWNFHAGRGEFHNIKRYMNAFNHRYGESKSVEEFAFKSQAANYEAMRPMYEAFSVNLPRTTGIVQWMLNASWPKLYWQLYDYDLMPGGAYFGAKKGAAPIAIAYNYGDQGIYLVNQSDRSLGDFRTTITVRDLNSVKILDQILTNAAPSFGSKKILDLASVTSPTPVYFVELATRSVREPTIHADNFYWLSTKQDVLDEEKSEWYVTPNKSFSDFTALTNLPTANVRASISYHTTKPDDASADVTLANTGDHLAFFMEMRLVDAKSGKTLLPVRWDDNYVSLPPHVGRTYHVRLPVLKPDEKPELRAQGWNVHFEMAK